MSTKGGIIDSAAQCHMGKIISEEFTSANDLKAEDTNNLKSEIELLRMESHHYKQLLFDAGISPDLSEDLFNSEQWNEKGNGVTVVSASNVQLCSAECPENDKSAAGVVFASHSSDHYGGTVDEQSSFNKNNFSETNFSAITSCSTTTSFSNQLITMPHSSGAVDWSSLMNDSFPLPSDTLAEVREEMFGLANWQNYGFLAPSSVVPIASGAAGVPLLSPMALLSGVTVVTSPLDGLSPTSLFLQSAIDSTAGSHVRALEGSWFDNGQNQPADNSSFAVLETANLGVMPAAESVESMESNHVQSPATFLGNTQSSNSWVTSTNLSTQSLPLSNATTSELQLTTLGKDSQAFSQHQQTLMTYSLSQSPLLATTQGLGTFQNLQNCQISADNQSTNLSHPSTGMNAPQHNPPPSQSSASQQQTPQQTPSGQQILGNLGGMIQGTLVLQPNGQLLLLPQGHPSLGGGGTSSGSSGVGHGIAFNPSVFASAIRQGSISFTANSQASTLDSLVAPTTSASSSVQQVSAPSTVRSSLFPLNSLISVPSQSQQQQPLLQQQAMTMAPYTQQQPQQRMAMTKYQSVSVNTSQGLMTVNSLQGQPNQLPSALLLPNGQIVPVVTQPGLLFGSAGNHNYMMAGNRGQQVQTLMGPSGQIMQPMQGGTININGQQVQTMMGWGEKPVGSLQAQQAQMSVLGANMQQTAMHMVNAQGSTQSLARMPVIQSGNGLAGNTSAGSLLTFPGSNQSGNQPMDISKFLSAHSKADVRSEGSRLASLPPTLTAMVTPEGNIVLTLPAMQPSVGTVAMPTLGLTNAQSTIGNKALTVQQRKAQKAKKAGQRIIMPKPIRSVVASQGTAPPKVATPKSVAEGTNVATLPSSVHNAGVMVTSKMENSTGQLVGTAPAVFSIPKKPVGESSMVSAAAIVATSLGSSGAPVPPATTVGTVSTAVADILAQATQSIFSFSPSIDGWNSPMHDDNPLQIDTGLQAMEVSASQGNIILAAEKLSMQESVVDPNKPKSKPKRPKKKALKQEASQEAPQAQSMPFSEQQQVQFGGQVPQYAPAGSELMSTTVPFGDQFALMSNVGGANMSNVVPNMSGSVENMNGLLGQNVLANMANMSDMYAAMSAMMGQNGLANMSAMMGPNGLANMSAMMGPNGLANISAMMGQCGIPSMSTMMGQNSIANMSAMMGQQGMAVINDMSCLNGMGQMNAALIGQQLMNATSDQGGNVSSLFQYNENIFNDFQGQDLNDDETDINEFSDLIMINDPELLARSRKKAEAKSTVAVSMPSPPGDSLTVEAALNNEQSQLQSQSSLFDSVMESWGNYASQLTFEGDAPVVREGSDFVSNGTVVEGVSTQLLPESLKEGQGLQMGSSDSLSSAFDQLAKISKVPAQQISAGQTICDNLSFDKQLQSDIFGMQTEELATIETVQKEQVEQIREEPVQEQPDPARGLLNEDNFLEMALQGVCTPMPNANAPHDLLFPSSALPLSSSIASLCPTLSASEKTFSNNVVTDQHLSLSNLNTKLNEEHNEIVSDLCSTTAELLERKICAGFEFDSCGSQPREQSGLFGPQSSVDLCLSPQVAKSARIQCSTPAFKSGTDLGVLCSTPAYKSNVEIDLLCTPFVVAQNIGKMEYLTSKGKEKKVDSSISHNRDPLDSMLGSEKEINGESGNKEVEKEEEALKSPTKSKFSLSNLVCPELISFDFKLATDTSQQDMEEISDDKMDVSTNVVDAGSAVDEMSGETKVLTDKSDRTISAGEFPDEKVDAEEVDGQVVKKTKRARGRPKKSCRKESTKENDVEVSVDNAADDRIAVQKENTKQKGKRGRKKKNIDAKNSTDDSPLENVDSTGKIEGSKSLERDEVLVCSVEVEQETALDEDHNRKSSRLVTEESVEFSLKEEESANVDESRLSHGEIPTKSNFGQNSERQHQHQQKDVSNDNKAYMEDTQRLLELQASSEQLLDDIMSQEATKNLKTSRRCKSKPQRFLRSGKESAECEIESYDIDAQSSLAEHESAIVLPEVKNKGVPRGRRRKGAEVEREEGSEICAPQIEIAGAENCSTRSRRSRVRDVTIAVESKVDLVEAKTAEEIEPESISVATTSNVEHRAVSEGCSLESREMKVESTAPVAIGNGEQAKPCDVGSSVQAAKDDLNKKLIETICQNKVLEICVENCLLAVPGILQNLKSQKKLAKSQSEDASEKQQETASEKQQETKVNEVKLEEDDCKEKSIEISPCLDIKVSEVEAVGKVSEADKKQQTANTAVPNNAIRSVRARSLRSSHGSMPNPAGTAPNSGESVLLQRPQRKRKESEPSKPEDVVCIKKARASNVKSKTKSVTSATPLKSLPSATISPKKQLLKRLENIQRSEQCFSALESLRDSSTAKFDVFDFQMSENDAPLPFSGKSNFLCSQFSNSSVVDRFPHDQTDRDSKFISAKKRERILSVGQEANGDTFPLVEKSSVDDSLLETESTNAEAVRSSEREDYVDRAEEGTFPDSQETIEEVSKERQEGKRHKRTRDKRRKKRRDTIQSAEILEEDLRNHGNVVEEEIDQCDRLIVSGGSTTVEPLQSVAGHLIGETVPLGEGERRYRKRKKKKVPTATLR